MKWYPTAQPWWYLELPQIKSLRISYEGMLSLVFLEIPPEFRFPRKRKTEFRFRFPRKRNSDFHGNGRRNSDFHGNGIPSSVSVENGIPFPRKTETEDGIPFPFSAETENGNGIPYSAEMEDGIPFPWKSEFRFRGKRKRNFRGNFFLFFGNGISAEMKFDFRKNPSK